MSGVGRQDTPEEPRCPAFGVGGDYAGARRARRAFRMLVAACVVLTGMLYFVEEFKRYDLNETNYRRALTHHPESARSFMRSVVKREREEHEKPNPRYIEFLAAIEEEDKVLALYNEAYQLNSGDGSLLINYGCHLYQAGQYLEARERFREAGLVPPPNALPRYLQAAAMTAVLPPDGDLGPALALVASANNSGDPVAFPRPLWHHSLPRDGEWYSNLRRGLVQDGCRPLNSFVAQFVERARKDIDAGQVANWDSWLRQVQIMGERLVGAARTPDESLGTVQTLTGLHMQLDALRLRRAIAEQRGAATEAVDARIAAVTAALDQVIAFEAEREARIAAHREVVKQPLALTLFDPAASWIFVYGRPPYCSAAMLLVGLYLLSALIAKAADPQRKTLAIEHGPTCAVAVVAGHGCGLVALFALLLTRNLPSAETWSAVFSWLWIAALVGMVCYGPLYPLVRLPRVRDAVDTDGLAPEEQEALLALARRYRRKAWATLTRRYYGILLGGLVVVLCLWVVGFRVVASIYPMEIKLLVTGLERGEVETVRLVQESLR